MPNLVDRDARIEVPRGVDERRARAQLRGQISRLEARLTRLGGEAFGRTALPAGPAGGPERAPRLLDLGGLEAARDRLAARVAEAEAALRERDRLEAENRALLDRLLADPAGHRWLRISRDDLGEPGCGHWHALPRLGPLGMMLGWWRVRISSGCPLPGRREAADEDGEHQGA